MYTPPVVPETGAGDDARHCGGASDSSLVGDVTATTPAPQTFDSALWSAAQRAQAPESLHDLVEATFRRERDQLTVETVIADRVEPGERLALAGAGAVSGCAWAGPIAVLRIGEGEDAYTVGVWPTTESGIYHLVGTVPVTDERWRRVERWLANSAPRVVPFVLNQADFDGIGAALTEHGRVEVSRLTARVLTDGSSYTRGWAEGRRSPAPPTRKRLERSRTLPQCERSPSMSATCCRCTYGVKLVRRSMEAASECSRRSCCRRLSAPLRDAVRS